MPTETVWRKEPSLDHGPGGPSSYESRLVACQWRAKIPRLANFRSFWRAARWLSDSKCSFCLISCDGSVLSF